MKRLLFIFSFFFLFVLNGKTQEVEILTLEDCLRIGIDNNLSLEGKRKEIQKSKYGVSENRSKLLPQINAIAGYNNNFDPPVSVTDGSSYGVPYNITKTLQHSANAGLEMQMPLFNQTLYTSMSIAKVMEEISRLSYGKAREDVILQISKMYYLGQVTAEQIMLIKANITRLEELRDITQAFFDNGMSMEVDLKRVNINLENLKVQYDNAQAMMKQQLNMLKYIMDYPAEKEIALTPVNTDSITTVALTGLSENIYELQLSQSQVQLAERQKKIITNGYIPSLSLTGSWRYAAYTDKGYHWFHSGPSNQWFRSYGVGLTLRIPIFDGLDKTYKIKIMDKEYVMRVAATIREQLVTMTDTPVLMSWGIGEFMATVFNDLPGLKFHVNGRLFQGEVLICLNGSDYYEVYLRNGTDIECLSDEVCFDELGELIDRHIESGTDKEEYARFCEQAAMSFGFGN